VLSIGSKQKKTKPAHFLKKVDTFIMTKSILVKNINGRTAVKIEQVQTVEKSASQILSIRHTNPLIQAKNHFQLVEVISAFCNYSKEEHKKLKNLCQVKTNRVNRGIAKGMEIFKKMQERGFIRKISIEENSTGLCIKTVIHKRACLNKDKKSVMMTIKMPS
jgi:hypothetical protein